MIDIIESLGGPTAVAGMTGVRPPSVVEWRSRGIPADRCPAIEKATEGKFTVEQLRPDVTWIRVKDRKWPHPSGRPCIDVAKP
jgi:DNA-binding transcriptional regulator YdaS (Cro superfamily)